MKVTTDLAAHKSINEYIPQVGDWVDWRGWILGHWCGPISSIDQDGVITITTAGLPYLVFIGKTEVKKIKLNEITSSVNGEYSISRAERNILLWFV